MKLYKYRCIDDNALSAIRDSTLWFSSPVDLNDPYDCQLNMYPFGIKEEWRLFLSNILTGPYKDQLIHEYIELRQIHNDPGFASKMLRPIAENHGGVCCFSRIRNSIPMWSHYADKHRGICIEYDSDKSANLADLFEVIYCTEYPKISVRDTLEAIVKKSLTSKADAWSYEQEYRLFTYKGRVSLKVERRSLTGIIFGCRCPLEDKEKVIDALKTYVPVPKLYEAKTETDKYEIKIVQCSEDSILRENS